MEIDEEHAYIIDPPAYVEPVKSVEQVQEPSSSNKRKRDDNPGENPVEQSKMNAKERRKVKRARQQSKNHDLQQQKEEMLRQIFDNEAQFIKNNQSSHFNKFVQNYNALPISHQNWWN